MTTRVRTATKIPWGNDDDAAELDGSTILGRVRLNLDNGRTLPALLLLRADEAGRQIFFALYLVPSTGAWKVCPVDDLSDGHGARRR